MKGLVKNPLQKKTGDQTAAIQCPACGQAIPEGAKFCMNCGAKVPEKTRPTHCPGCGTKLPENARFCMECGLKTDPAGQAAPQAKQPTAPAAAPGKKEKKAGKKWVKVLALMVLALLALKVLFPGLAEQNISGGEDLLSVISGTSGVSYVTLSARDISMEVPQGVILERANEEGDGNIIATGNGIHITMMNWNGFAIDGIEALAQEHFDREKQTWEEAYLFRSDADANTPYIGVYTASSVREHITLYCNSQKETWTIMISLDPAQTEGVSWETMADSIRFH